MPCPAISIQTAHQDRINRKLNIGSSHPHNSKEEHDSRFSHTLLSFLAYIPLYELNIHYDP
jgi:hypothetical protein